MTIACSHVLTAKRMVILTDDGQVKSAYWLASLSHMDGIIEVRGDEGEPLSSCITRTLQERASRRVDDPLPATDW